MKLALPRPRLQPSPILIKEMRSTMRGGRTFIALTFFLLILAGLSLLIYQAFASDPYGPSAAEAGRLIFTFVGVIEGLMLCVVTPPLTSGAIANERQKQTFEMLMATPLTPGQVLRGKLLASMNYLLLMMFAGIPINAIVFLFGGVDPQTLLWWVALVLVVVLMLGTLGLLMSTLMRSSGVATSVTYLICALLFVMVPFAMLFGITLFWRGSEPTGLACYSPLVVGLLHPGASLAAIIANADELNARMILPATLPFYGAVAALLYLGAEARLTRLVGQRWPRSRWLMALLLLLIVASALLYLLIGPARALCQSL